MEVTERRLSPEGIKFLASATVDAYTVQHRLIVEKLEAGVTHRQPWKMTAAFTGTDRDLDGNAHRRAYFWYAAHFPKYKARRLRNAPSWVFFDPDAALRTRKNDDEIAIHLEVPRHELLIMHYTVGPGASWERVLSGLPCCDHDPTVRFCPQCGMEPMTRRRRRESWESLFRLSGSPREWQGLIDRLESSWLKGRLD